MGEGNGEVRGEGTMARGKAVLVAEMYSQSEERREGLVHSGLGLSMEETTPRRRLIASLLAGQERMAWFKVF